MVEVGEQVGVGGGPVVVNVQVLAAPRVEDVEGGRTGHRHIVDAASQVGGWVGGWVSVRVKRWEVQAHATLHRLDAQRTTRSLVGVLTAH